MLSSYKYYLGGVRMAKKTLPIENISLPKDEDNKIIYSTGDPTTYGALINNLYQRVEGLKKTVSYLDFYNISDAVTNEVKFSEQLNKLPLNQSLVINTAPFQHGGVSYSTGDILTKTTSNEILHIKAQTGGVFFPESITKTIDKGIDLLPRFAIGAFPIVVAGVIRQVVDIIYRMHSMVTHLLYRAVKRGYTHDLTHTAGKDAGCEEDGVREYWHCGLCWKSISKSNAKCQSYCL